MPLMTVCDYILAHSTLQVLCVTKENISPLYKIQTQLYNFNENLKLLPSFHILYLHFVHYKTRKKHISIQNKNMLFHSNFIAN